LWRGKGPVWNALLGGILLGEVMDKKMGPKNQPMRLKGLCSLNATFAVLAFLMTAIPSAIFFLSLKQSTGLSYALAKPALILGWGIQSADLKPGTGEKAQVGDEISFNYEMFLFDANRPDGKGQKVYSSYEDKQVYKIRLGGRQVVPGLEVGLYNMQAGGKKRLKVSPLFAYGPQDSSTNSPIPKDSTLIFEVERTLTN